MPSVREIMKAFKKEGLEIASEQANAIQSLFASIAKMDHERAIEGYILKPKIKKNEKGSRIR